MDVLDERRPGDPPLPAELRASLREWAACATTLALGSGPDEVELLRRRGRQLAARVAGVLGRPVEFVDPATGSVESVPVGASGAPERGEARPSPAWPTGSPGPTAPTTGPPPWATGPTPWATGLAVAAFAAVFVALGDVALSRAFGAALGLLWLPANLLIGLGLAPTLWLGRRTPVWRWIALGATAGLGAAWVVLLLGLLG